MNLWFDSPICRVYFIGGHDLSEDITKYLDLCQWWHIYPALSDGWMVEQPQLNDLCCQENSCFYYLFPCYIPGFSLHNAFDLFRWEEQHITFDLACLMYLLNIRDYSSTLHASTNCRILINQVLTWKECIPKCRWHCTWSLSAMQEFPVRYIFQCLWNSHKGYKKGEIRLWTL